ncbi:MAG: hypothetical protein ACI93T_004288 [Porticoccaceae bacterium]|jgi:hypothetical protein
MARNLEAPVRPNLLSQVPASPIKRSERLNFGEAFIADVSHGKHRMRNRLERGCDDRLRLSRQAVLRFRECRVRRSGRG